jgi:hypothetical protein
MTTYTKPDPESADTARELLCEFRRKSRRIDLSPERADALEQRIADAIHDAKGIPK